MKHWLSQKIHNASQLINCLSSLLLCLLSLTVAIGQGISVIPIPVTVQPGTGSFEITHSTTLSVAANQKEARKVAAYFADKLTQATGYSLKIIEPATAGIQLNINPKPDTRIGQEGYTLEVQEKMIKLNANTPAGLFYGVQTLLQLLPPEIERKTVTTNIQWKIPVVAITDYPRFGWRGVMLDVSRHFFTKDYVRNFIDQISRYKFNRFHWHLTDDNGWRVEIKSLPKLTEVGSWRVPRTGTFGSHEAPKPGEKASYGGYYTQEDIKEIVQYAKDRFIEILPEIDVPGHSMAAIASYPELCVTNDTTIRVNPGSNYSRWFGDGKFEMYIDNTLDPTDDKVYQFLDKVFTEIAILFPFEYIHIGGDECYKGYWERDAGVQAFMKKNNIKTGVELQSYFTRRLSKIIASKKKKPIGWDEILEGGIAPEAAVMSWRGVKGGIEASHLKHAVVMSPSPEYYLDMGQGEPSIEPPIYSIARLKEVYAFDIIAPGIDSTYVLGGQGNLWTEQIPTPAQAEYMTYPRAFAVGENLWASRSKKNWDSFISRVEAHFLRLDQARINYSPAMYDPIIQVTKNKEGRLVVELLSEVPGLDIYYTIDNTFPGGYGPTYSNPIVFPPDVDQLRVITYRDNKPLGRLISIRTEDLEKRVRKK